MKGHEFLKKEFNFVPRNGWLIDSFGHSAANARLYADAGIETLFVGRLDRMDKEKRFEEKGLNFLWRPFPNSFGHQHQILVSAFKDHYCWPPGFYVDERYDGDEPFVTDSTLGTFNAETKALEFINYVQMLARHHRERHILLPWGCDFSHANAKLNFD